MHIEQNVDFNHPDVKRLKKALSNQVKNHGLRSMHIDWGPTGLKMSPEERAAYVVDHVINRDTSKDVKITASEFDRQTLAPHISKDVWDTATKEQRDRMIGRVNVKEWVDEIERHKDGYYGA